VANQPSVNHIGTVFATVFASGRLILYPASALLFAAGLYLSYSRTKRIRCYLTCSYGGLRPAGQLKPAPVEAPCVRAHLTAMETSSGVLQKLLGAGLEPL
jgi:hypothetical protein